MDTNFFQTTDYTDHTDFSLSASPQEPANPEGFRCEYEIQKERLPTAACGSAVRHASRKRKQRHAKTLDARDLTTNGHEWTRIFCSPLKTLKKQKASQTSAMVLKSLLSICYFDQGGIG